MRAVRGHDGDFSGKTDTMRRAQRRHNPRARPTPECGVSSERMNGSHTHARGFTHGLVCRCPFGANPRLRRTASAPPALRSFAPTVHRIPAQSIALGMGSRHLRVPTKRRINAAPSRKPGIQQRPEPARPNRISDFGKAPHAQLKPSNKIKKTAPVSRGGLIESVPACRLRISLPARLGRRRGGRPARGKASRKRRRGRACGRTSPSPDRRRARRRCRA
jgi:hypothetical protein